MSPRHRSARAGVLLLGSLAALSLALTGLLLALRVTPGAGPGRGGVDAGDPPTAASSATEVLGEWTRLRSAAWTAGDPAALAALYGPGSRAGRADLALLRRYLRRGLTVQGMQTQLVSVDVRRRGPGLLVLGVTDRLVGGIAVAEDGSRLRLPTDQPTRHVVTLRLVGGDWRVERISSIA